MVGRLRDVPIQQYLLPWDEQVLILLAGEIGLQRSLKVTAGVVNQEIWTSITQKTTNSILVCLQIKQAIHYALT